MTRECLAQQTLTLSGPRRLPAPALLHRSRCGSPRASGTRRPSRRALEGARPDPLAGRAFAVVRQRWRARVRRQRRKQAATTGGITVETRARVGYTASIGTTDDGRVRRLTVHLPAQYARRLFDARDAGAGERQLRQVIAAGLQEVYSKGGGRRADDLEVECTGIVYLDLGY
ncbi:telomere-protecting terminal protein Tpg [Streptomyces sp. NPDC050585]|uniref:telomere-protecting terminal protein Tpg n=1 Tax=Streptomyces sp. NPDC050585 TaxID=3365632 RepID=UPI0037929E85